MSEADVVTVSIRVCVCVCAEGVFTFDLSLRGHMTTHPVCDCCCLAAMTTNFKSWMNGIAEETDFLL